MAKKKAAKTGAKKAGGKKAARRLAVRRLPRRLAARRRLPRRSPPPRRAKLIWMGSHAHESVIALLVTSNTAAASPNQWRFFVGVTIFRSLSVRLEIKKAIVFSRSPFSFSSCLSFSVGFSLAKLIRTVVLLVGNSLATC